MGGPVSRVLYLRLVPLKGYPKRLLSFIWCSLPPGNGRATLNCRYTWPCRMQRDTAVMSPSQRVGSYPTFSPLPQYAPKGNRSISEPDMHAVKAAPAAVVFCYPHINSSPICAFHSTMPFPARTFLPIS